MARTTIFDNGHFSLHAHIRPVAALDGSLALTISSTLQTARRPQDEQVRFFACLEPQGLQALATLIQTALQAQQQGETA